jgi:hypothetical protein
MFEYGIKILHSYDLTCERLRRLRGDDFLSGR